MNIAQGEAARNGWGGKRAGAGRPLKALAYRDSVRRAEALAAGSLPQLIRMLVKRALEQDDVKAAIYLVDRICGRPTSVVTIPAEDVREPPRTRDEADMVLFNRVFSALEPGETQRILDTLGEPGRTAVGCIEPPAIVPAPVEPSSSPDDEP